MRHQLRQHRDHPQVDLGSRPRRWTRRAEAGGTRPSPALRPRHSLLSGLSTGVDSPLARRQNPSGDHNERAQARGVHRRHASCTTAPPPRLHPERTRLHDVYAPVHEGWTARSWDRDARGPRSAPCSASPGRPPNTSTHQPSQEPSPRRAPSKRMSRRPPTRRSGSAFLILLLGNAALVPSQPDQLALRHNPPAGRFTKPYTGPLASVGGSFVRSHTPSRCPYQSS